MANSQLVASRKATKPKIACYCRVSTADQSNDSQRAEIRSWLKREGVNSDRYAWYLDKVSGTTNERPALKRLMRDVEAGRITTVVVFKLDRLARNLKAGLETLETLAKHKVRVVATSQNLDISGALGNLLTQVLLATSEFEVETRRERVLAGVRHYREKNGKWGRPRNTAKYAQVRKLRSSGKSVEDIAFEMKLTRQGVYYLLRQCDAGTPKGKSE